MLKLGLIPYIELNHKVSRHPMQESESSDDFSSNFSLEVTSRERVFNDSW